MLEVSLNTKQGEDVFELVRRTPCLQDYLKAGVGLPPPLSHTDSQPPLEVSKLVECKVASWLQTVDSWVGTGEEVEVLDAEERKDFLPVDEEVSFFFFLRRISTLK